MKGLEDALDFAQWFGAEHAAAALVGPGGLIASSGDVARPFHLASVTKLLTVYAALVALEERTLALDTPAGPPGATVAHLMAHASGLGPNTNVPLNPPGTRRIYSNAGIEVLAQFLEGASGIRFPDYLAQAIFGPLAMEAVLVGSPAHGVSASIADLVKFASELLTPQLIGPETLHLATSVAFPGLAGVLPGFGRQDPCDWGLGFELRDHKSPHWTGATSSTRTFGHFGQSGTFLLVDPVLERSLILLTDRAFGPWAAAAWPPFVDAVMAAATR